MGGAIRETNHDPSGGEADGGFRGVNHWAARRARPEPAIGPAKGRTRGSTHPAGCQGPPRASAHKPNTYSTVALRWSLSSGVASSFVREVALGPDAIAIYCLPLTSNVIGGAPNPAPTLIFQSWLREVSSKAATVPSRRARNTSPPAVASAPE